MSTKRPHKLAAILAITLFGCSSAVVGAAPVGSRQVQHETATANPGSVNVVDKSGSSALQLLIFIHRANLPVGSAMQGAQR